MKTQLLIFLLAMFACEVCRAEDPCVDNGRNWHTNDPEMSVKESQKPKCLNKVPTPMIKAQPVGTQGSNLPQTPSGDTNLAVTAVVATPVTEVAPKVEWVARREDGTIRQVIAKWAKQTGWDLVWTVDRDLEIETNASFSGEFKDAIRSILALSKYSNDHVKPCFHTNSVVRVIRATSRCGD